LRIVWPDGVEEFLYDLPSNTGPVVIQEGSGVVGTPTPVPTPVPQPTPTPSPVPQLADLTVTALRTPPPTAAPGSTFETADITKNIGNVTAPPTITAYYLSPTRAPTGPGIVRLAETHAVPELAPGEQDWAEVVVTVPPTITPGDYYIIAVADDTRLVPELDDTFNFHSNSAVISIQ
jgi:hypothetical protein